MRGNMNRKATEDKHRLEKTFEVHEVFIGKKLGSSSFQMRRNEADRKPDTKSASVE